MKDKNKKTWIGIGAFLLYFIITEYQGLPFLLLEIDTNKISVLVKIIYICSIQIILIGTLFYIYKNDIQKNWLDLKKNHKSYFKKYLKYWFVMLALMMISNFIILIFQPNSIASNEEAVRQMFSDMPIYTFISAVIFAPLLEELVFRKSFRYMFSDDIVFIILSGLTFGAFHIVGSAESLFELVYLIPYSIPGFVFAYTLVKSKNIFVPMGLHFIHNGILMSLQVLLMFLS